MSLEIQDAISRCTNMDDAAFDECVAPNKFDYEDLLYAEDVGVVKLYGRDLFGQVSTKMLNFTKLKSEPKELLNQKSSILKDLGFDNKMEMLEVNLKPGWSIVFFEYADGTGRSHKFINSLSPIYLSQNFPQFNQKASSFILLRDK